MTVRVGAHDQPGGHIGRYVGTMACLPDIMICVIEVTGRLRCLCGDGPRTVRAVQILSSLDSADDFR